jgi:chromosome segregation protein
MLAHYVSGPSCAQLLGGVRVARSLKDARRIRDMLETGESVVTPDGIWLGKDWVRVNSDDDPQRGVISRGEEIETLRHTIDEASNRLEDLAAKLKKTRADLGQIEERHAELQSQANEQQRRYAQAKGELETVRVSLDQVRSRAANLDRGISDLELEAKSVLEALKQSRDRLGAVGKRAQGYDEERQELDAVREPLRRKFAEARAAAEEYRDRAQEIAIKVESRRSSKESAAAGLHRIRAQLDHLQRRRSELQQQLESSAAPLADEEQRLVDLLDQRLSVEEDLAAARRALEGVDTRLRDVDQQRADKHQSVSEAREVLDNTRLSVREAQVRAETVRDQFKQTGFDLNSTQDELPADATLPQWEENFESLERRIQRLGNINLAAIDEYQEQAERKAYLDAQFKDLSEALETLENAIRKIDRETRTRFKETFDHANAGLGRLFPRLFGGGHAYLELDGDDLLNAGVTVMARPPGKRISTIHLLSGGEKALTAVALVFSIFELNPAPFCLLDEVDAPLDDANVGRFSEIVKEMSDQVQFVLITHNKVTMETMKQLTGVTMNEPGVSRLVAVDIDEAVQLAAM